jgi:hypothetical protein
VIGGGELKIDSVKMGAIMKGLVPTNYTKVSSFVGEAKYLWKFIVSFSIVVTPLHTTIVSGKRL